MRKRALLFISLAFVVLGGAERFMSAYDHSTRRGATELQSKVHRFFDRLERAAGTPDGEWERHSEFYGSVRRDLESLRFFARLQPASTPALQALDRTARNLDLVEDAHFFGLVPEEVPLLRGLVETELRTLVETAGNRSRAEAP